MNIVQNLTTTNTFEIAGNGGVFSFTVQEPLGCDDITSPSLTLNQAVSQADPSSSDSATFKVVFDEAINIATFASGDITLSGTTGTITSGPTEVAPNNATSFEFTVTGMTDGDTVTASIAAGLVADAAGNTNNASTSSDNAITYSGGDTTPPVVTSISAASGSLLPGGVHDIVIEYNDADSGINTATATMQLSKWDGISTYGPDISGSALTTNTVT